jgi:CheY-like chemotaxis protein
VTNISHELRTPLNLIVGFSEMIVTSPESYGVSLPTEYRGDLNAIYRSAEHLLALTQDVLDLARVGAGRMALAREPVNLGQIVNDACAIVREYVEAKGLTLLIRLPPDLPQMMLDRLRIRQVILNLLTNAARFTEYGSIEVSVMYEKHVATIRVTDTGSGIPPTELPKVFDEFYHTSDEDSSSAKSFRGVGLGLPLSKRFVELHEGEMGVDSIENVGTTFWFSLPVGHLDYVIAEPSKRSLGPILASSGTEHILILCSPDIRLGPFLQHHLRGCRVLAAPDLISASSMAIRYRSTAILADIEIEVPADCDDLPVPLIRIPLPNRDRMAAALGVSAYLVKPVSRNDLHAAIERVGTPIRKILIADDDERFTRLMTRLLHSTATQSIDGEREILVAHNGEEALDLLEASRPDLLLLDLVMPGLDGHGVLSAITARSHLCDIPVIVISAQDQDEGHLRLDGILSILKPEGFRFEELLGAIDGLLDVLEPPRRYLTMTTDQDHFEPGSLSSIEVE